MDQTDDRDDNAASTRVASFAGSSFAGDHSYVPRRVAVRKAEHADCVAQAGRVEDFAVVRAIMYAGRGCACYLEASPRCAGPHSPSEETGV